MNNVSRVILYVIGFIVLVLAIQGIKNVYNEHGVEVAYKDNFITACVSQNATESQCKCLYDKAKDQAGGHREVAAYLNDMSEGTMGVFVQSCL